MRERSKGEEFGSTEADHLGLRLQLYDLGTYKGQPPQQIKMRGDLLEDIQIPFYLRESIQFTLKQDLCTLESKTLKGQVCNQI